MDFSSDSDLEAAIQSRLQKCTDSPPASPSSQPSAIAGNPPSRTTKARNPRRRDRHRRRRSLDPDTASPPLSTEMALRSALHESATASTKRAVSLALVTAQVSSSTTSHPSPSIASRPPTRVVRARSLPSALSLHGGIRKRAHAKAQLHNSVKLQVARNDDAEDAASFVDEYRREIGRFGASGLDKSARREFELADMQKLGCRKPKNERVPIGILQRRRRNDRESAREKRESDLASGMLVRSKRSKNK